MLKIIIKMSFFSGQKPFYLKTIATLGILSLNVSCNQDQVNNDNNTQKIDAKEYRKLEFRKQVSFYVNNKPFTLTPDHIASQRLNEFKRSYIKLFFADESIQTFDIIFFTPTENTKFPFTYKFIDNKNSNPDSTNYAVCFWKSMEINGWHEVILENSFITITKWDPDTHLISGTFQAFIRDTTENKTDTIKITKGVFSDIRYSDDRHFYK